MCQKKLHFLLVSLYRGLFGGPRIKWVQKLHFLLVSLYRGPFGGPVGKVGAEIALLDSSASIVDHLVAQE